MKAAELIKQAREKKGWTQKQLADAVAVTPGFITKLEAEQALPSYELCTALANMLGLSLDRLWAAVEQARAEALQQRIRTRGAAVRGALRTRGAPRGPRATPSPQEISVEEIAAEVAADPDLLAAYRHLKTALTDPAMRQTVLQALEAFARAASAEPMK